VKIPFITAALDRRRARAGLQLLTRDAHFVAMEDAEGDEYGDAHHQGTDFREDDPAPTAVDIREYVDALAA